MTTLFISDLHLDSTRPAITELFGRFADGRLMVAALDKSTEADHAAAAVAHLPGGADLTEMSKSAFSEAENAGIGFGLGFACNMHPAKTLVPSSLGEFYWGGMFSTAFNIDPLEQVHFVFMTQLMPSSTYPVRREIRTMINSALAA